MNGGLRVEVCTGDALAARVPELARLRIEVFRDFPYLYEGDLDYEARYLETYIRAPGSVVVLALDGDRAVGASTAVPLVHETEEVRRPFADAGFDAERVFYLGESVLLQRYRGRGLGVRFFAEREAHARRLGGFAWSAFCAVERPDDHPLRPRDYVPLHGFWNRRGYARRDDLRTGFRWRDLGEAEQTEKPMVFWLKPLAEAA